MPAHLAGLAQDTSRLDLHAWKQGCPLRQCCCLTLSKRPSMTARCVRCERAWLQAVTGSDAVGWTISIPRPSWEPYQLLQAVDVQLTGRNLSTGRPISITRKQARTTEGGDMYMQSCHHLQMQSDADPCLPLTVLRSHRAAW